MEEIIGVVTEQGMPNAVSFEGVSVEIGGVLILDSVNAQVPKGGCTAIVGPNGAGKTTLIMTLLGDLPHSGRIRLAEGRGGGAPRLGYVPQRLSFDRDMPLTVAEFLSAGVQRMPFWFGVSRKRMEESRKLLEDVECAHLLKRRLGGLSGGELQRVLLALALQEEPDILILDEPAAGVDLKGDQICCSLLERARVERGFTELMVSHDLSTVSAHATHVVCLNRTVYAAGAPKEVLTPQVLASTFGLHMGMPDSHSIPAGERLCDAPCCKGKAKTDA